MKLYKKMKRAIALEIGDLHFKMGEKFYPWYDEDDFPSNMEEIVREDNPFGGWYRYIEDYVYVEYIEVEPKENRGIRESIFDGYTYG